MNEYQWHGPAMTMPTVPVPVTPPRSRPFAAVAASLAALLVPIASFLPLYGASGLIDGESASFSISSWGFSPSMPELVGDPPINGPLLIVATVVLLVAAALCWVAASRSARPGIVRAAAVVTVAGAAFLTSGVWTIVMETVSHASGINPPRDPEEAAAFEEGAGAGLWLLVAGAVVALVAMVFALRATRSASTTPTG